MAKKYVPDGVFLACDKGTCPSTYKVRFDNQTNVYSVPLASELDIIPFLNIKPMGFCMVKGMCTPMPLPWTGYKSDVMINGRLLLEDSTCQCLLGGKISIHFTRASANAVALWGGAKMPTEYIKEGFDWMAEQKEQSRKLRDQNLPGWMQSVAGVTDWMDDFGTGLVEGAVNGVVGLGEAVYQVAQDPVGTAEALGGMAKKGWDWASEGDNWSNAANGAWNWASDGDNWVNAATDGAKWVADNPRGMGNGIGQFIPDAVAAVYTGGGSLAATAGKTVVKEGLEAGGKAALREGVEGGLERATREVVGEAAEAGARRTGREAVEEMLEHADDGHIPIVQTGARRADEMVESLVDPEDMERKWQEYLAKNERAGKEPRLSQEQWENNYKNKHKGIVGEHIVDDDLVNRRGLQKINDDGTLVQLGDAPKGPGIDGIYRNPSPPPDYYVVDAKYDKASLGKAKDANGNTINQMSDEWILDDDRLSGALGGNRQQIRDFRSSYENGDVERLVGRVDPDGSVRYYTVDNGGNVGGAFNFPE